MKSDCEPNDNLLTLNEHCIEGAMKILIAGTRLVGLPQSVNHRLCSAIEVLEEQTVVENQVGRVLNLVHAEVIALVLEATGAGRESMGEPVAKILPKNV